MKVAACVEYDGSEFCGWQIQKGHPSVQQTVESALSSIANHTVRVHCAGRTDTGVHACGQIFHFETSSHRSDHSWVMGTNSIMPNSISLMWTTPVESSFHARFSAVSRTYRYILLNRKVRPSYLSKKTGWFGPYLDVERMNSAAAMLVGEYDFSAFRSSQCSNKVPVKTVYSLSVGRCDNWLWIDVEANGFLHHMVRNITGALLNVGTGDQEPEWVKHVLEERDRTKAGVTVPPDGLYFVKVKYPEKYSLPASPKACRFW